MNNLKLLLQALAKVFKPTRLYVVWNPGNVCQHTSLDEKSVIGLVDAEDRIDACISSLVRSNDIEATLEAVYNETNVQLCYSLYRTYKALFV